MNNNLLTVSSSPHILGCMTMRSMHMELILAMLPALITGIYFFGLPAAITVAVAVVSALVAEWAAGKIAKRPNNLGDLHALTMGLMMGLVLPPGAPWWIPLIGSALAVVLGKMIFGGLGAYPMNPVLIAWAALAISWPEQMNAFLAPLPIGSGDEWEVVPTFLMNLKDDVGLVMDPELGPLWWGNTPGAIGATGSWALIVGGLYLVVRGIVPWQIPFGTLLGAAGMALFATYVDPGVAEVGLESFGQHLSVVWLHLGTGGLMIAAFFLAPEPVSSPVTPWGMILYGLGIGFMAVIVRFWGSLTDGVFYGVLLMNAATPLLDRIRPRVLGKVMSGA